jgi:beta-fructofuranosidase
VSLRLPDHWLWDFWFAVDGDDVHVFYLQAPRALGDPLPYGP